MSLNHWCVAFQWTAFGPDSDQDLNYKSGSSLQPITITLTHLAHALICHKKKKTHQLQLLTFGEPEKIK